MGEYLHPSLHQLSAPLGSLGSLRDADGDVMKPSLQIRDYGKGQCPALQRIGFAKLHMMIHEHTPIALTPAKEKKKKDCLGPDLQHTGKKLFACQEMLP